LSSLRRISERLRDSPNDDGKTPMPSSADRGQAFVERARNISLRHFQETASKYDSVYGSIGAVHAECIQEFLGKLPPSPVILDAACGTGTYFEIIASRAGRLLGIDQSEAMLARAREKWPAIETEPVALQNLRFRDDLAKKFHGIVCIDALEWVMKSDWQTVLTGFRNVLVENGLLYVTIEIPGEDERRALAAEREDGAAPGEIGVHYWYNHFPKIDEVLTWTCQHGFREETRRQCAYYHHLLLRLS
jgi:cyclopropane fatty-acyl-phospholipid synthase-like methyltransferase